MLFPSTINLIEKRQNFPMSCFNTMYYFEKFKVLLLFIKSYTHNNNSLFIIKFN